MGTVASSGSTAPDAPIVGGGGGGGGGGVTGGGGNGDSTIELHGGYENIKAPDAPSPTAAAASSASSPATLQAAAPALDDSSAQLESSGELVAAAAATVETVSLPSLALAPPSPSVVSHQTDASAPTTLALAATTTTTETATTTTAVGEKACTSPPLPTFISARYGSDVRGYNVSDKIRKLLPWPLALDTIADPNRVFGFDPHPGARKHLTLTFSEASGAVRQIIALRELDGRWLQISVATEFDARLIRFSGEPSSSSSSSSSSPPPPPPAA